MHLVELKVAHHSPSYLPHTIGTYEKQAAPVRFAQPIHDDLVRDAEPTIGPNWESKANIYAACESRQGWLVSGSGGGGDGGDDGVGGHGGVGLH